MDLSLGEIELNGITFSKDTSIDEVLANSKFETDVDDNSPIGLSVSKQVDVEEYTFDVMITFENKRIKRIELTPVNLEMKDPDYPDEKYQEEKKKVNDAFLEKYLGEPHGENKNGVWYEYNWGIIISRIILWGRNEYTGGYICIEYKSI